MYYIHTWRLRGRHMWMMMKLQNKKGKRGKRVRDDGKNEELLKIDKDEDEGWFLITRCGLTCGGSAWKITASLSLTFSLEIAVDSVVAVILHCVWVVASSILEDRCTVCSSSTSIIYTFLKGLITNTIFTHTVKSTYGRRERQKGEKEQEKV